MPNIVVASVQYRRAPENRVAGAERRRIRGADWLAIRPANSTSTSRIGVGGDSAGAHLALGAAIEARDRVGRRWRRCCLSIRCPVPTSKQTSYRQHAVSPTLTRADMVEYWRYYLPSGFQTADVRAIPASASFHGLPRAHVLVAGLDPLHEDGMILAARLREIGVHVSICDEPTLTHGFLRAVPYVSRARDALREFGRAASSALRRSG